MQVKSAATWRRKNNGRCGNSLDRLPHCVACPSLSLSLSARGRRDKSREPANQSRTESFRPVYRVNLRPLLVTFAESLGISGIIERFRSLSISFFWKGLFPSSVEDEENAKCFENRCAKERKTGSERIEPVGDQVLHAFRIYSYVSLVLRFSNSGIVAISLLKGTAHAKHRFDRGINRAALSPANQTWTRNFVPSPGNFRKIKIRSITRQRVK